jgi:hypothetical protein
MNAQLTLFEEAKPDEEETTDVLAANLTGCDMTWGPNQKTLAAWVRKYGDVRVREMLSTPYSYGVIYFHNPGSRYLSRWEWQLFSPPEEVVPMCF